jgi:Uma2 family endonuclease
MVQYDPLQYLPTAEELPDSDDTPVDNELQNLVPTLLRAVLVLIWEVRSDWFFGINMGVYYHPRQPAIVPDGFLSLGVERFKDGKLRKSYVLWQENNTVPIWVLEVVSHTYGGEYENKMTNYAQMGVLYYAIYNPDYWRRDKHEPFELYRLVDGVYVMQAGEPVWMPEIGLGIGRGQGTYEGCTREWLYWYDQEGKKYPSQEEVRQQAEQRAEQLAAQLRALGIEPDEG